SGSWAIWSCVAFRNCSGCSSCRRNRVTSPPRLEKPAQQFRRLALLDAAVNFGAMVCRRLVEYPRAVLDPSAFRIIGGEIKPPDPGECDRGSAHRTRFEADIEIAAFEPFRPHPSRAFAQYQHLGMR